MKEIEKFPKKLKYSVSFINQLSDLYDEEGFITLTPGISNELNNSIDILEKYKNLFDWINDILDNVYSLRKRMPKIKII